MTNRLIAYFFLLLFLSITLMGQSVAGSETPVDKTQAEQISVVEEEEFDEYDDLDDLEEGDLELVADPIAGYNRVMHTVNDRLYFWVLKPVAKGYGVVVPSPVRAGVKNFFYNIKMPIRFLSCILQGKFKAADGEFGRFLVNSTIGVLGFFNPAKNYPELNPLEEDLGQTMGSYNIGNGFYIVWPVFGPSTLRDSVGTLLEWPINPFSYVEPLELSAGLYVFREVNNTSFRIGDYETLKDAALDPYTAFRDAYIQFRNSRIAQ